MADRTAAQIFSDVFVAIYEEVSPTWRNVLAKRIWDLTLNYDFSPTQMEIDETLEALHLAGRDEDGYWAYGPEGDRW